MLTAPTGYLGGKRRPAIRDKVAELSDRRDFWLEPSCGSMAMIFGQPKRKVEVLNDLYQDTINLGRCLACGRCAEELWRRTSSMLVHPDTFERARARLMKIRSGETPSMPNVAWALDYLTVAWLGPSDRVGTSEWPDEAYFAKRSTTTGGSLPTRWQGVSESIPWWNDRLRNVEFRNEDMFKLIESMNETGPSPRSHRWVIYADPPYIEEGIQYAVNDGWAYTPLLGDNHHRLADLLDSRQCLVIVSYYAHEALETLYPRSKWSIIDMAQTKNSANATGAETKSSPEVLIVNRAGLV